MKPALLRYVRCPDCGGELHLTSMAERPVDLKPEELAVLAARSVDPAGYRTEVLTGRLDCRPCKVVYPVIEGVPRIYRGSLRHHPLPDAAPDAARELNSDKAIQKTFDSEWADYEYEDDTIWHWTVDGRIATFCEELCIPDVGVLRGKVMVDAGCGPGILGMTLAERYGLEVVAFDLASVLPRAFRRNRSNLWHVIQGSVLAPPLAQRFADVTYSHGVLHHTRSTKEGFDAIEKFTKPGGLFYVWLYGRKKGWNRLKYMVIRTLRGVISRLPEGPQMAVIRLLAYMHVAIRGAKRAIGMDIAPIDSVPQLLVVTRDRYTPRYAREHTEAEVKGWFTAQGYQGVERRNEWATFDMFNGSTDLSIRGYKPG
jgi:SAM-dependent methyltransferase/uncharacterized protein YbaR (Trm112 family)